MNSVQSGGEGNKGGGEKTEEVSTVITCTYYK